MGRDRILQRAQLVTPEGAGAIQRMNLADVAAGHALDDAVELDERHLKVLRQHAPERGLACAAQPDERDARSRPYRRVRPERFRQRLARARKRRLVASTQEVAYACGFAACGDVLAHDLADRAAQCARQVAQQHHRRIALAGLEIGEVALRHAGHFGEPFAGHAATVPQRADALAQGGQEDVARAFFMTSSLIHVMHYLA